jgi:ATP-dependent Clp protease ATP-binding subunit ClpA
LESPSPPRKPFTRNKSSNRPLKHTNPSGNFQLKLDQPHSKKSLFADVWGKGPNQHCGLNAAADPLHVKLSLLEKHLQSQVLGQDHVITRVSGALIRSELGLRKPGRPRNSFVFLGQTGVGKTELTLAFTRYLHGPECISRFDMSEYQNQESLAQLLGERGSLALAVARYSKGTLLFDEIEKAHPRVLDVFLQILDAARITTNSGETLDLSPFTVVFTSNIASSDILDLQHSTSATLERHVLTRAQQQMRPELYARINEKLVFHKLTYEVLLQIAQQPLTHELAFLANQGLHVTPTEAVLPFLVRRGFHPRLGARPMRDAVEKATGDAVAQDLLTGGNACGRLDVDERGEGLCVTTCNDRAELSHSGLRPTDTPLPR